MNILQGNDLIISMGGKAIAGAKTCEVDIQGDQIEVANPTNGKWRLYMPARKGWQVTVGELLTNISTDAVLVNEIVSLEVAIRGTYGIPFSGFISGLTPREQSLETTPVGVFYDLDHHTFVAASSILLSDTTLFYNWSGSADFRVDNFFNYQEIVYHYTPTTATTGSLNAEKLTGQAIVKTWKATAARGTLAQGSFEFLGNGPLTPSALPSLST